MCLQQQQQQKSTKNNIVSNVYNLRPHIYSSFMTGVKKKYVAQNIKDELHEWRKLWIFFLLNIGQVEEIENIVSNTMI